MSESVLNYMYYAKAVNKTTIVPWRFLPFWKEGTGVIELLILYVQAQVGLKSTARCDGLELSTAVICQ